ncbi:MAG: DUF4270 family protein [Bernardetiaceae bacterium]|nr:DUF4270 family protein [Bernardetiaceae bacterium]
MSYYFRFILIIFALLPCFTACQDPEDLGLDLQNDEQSLRTDFTDTITVRSSVVLLDSINTTNSPRLLFGNTMDPFFGKIETTSYMRLSLGNARNVRFQGPAEEIATFDSLILELPINYTYGDTTVSQRIFVHRFAEPMEDSLPYFSNDSVRISASVLGSGFYPQNVDRSRGFFRIRLSNEFGRELFRLGGNLPDDDALQAAVAGIAIRGSGEDGAILGLSLSEAPGRLALYYSYRQLDTMTVDNFDFVFGRRFLNIKADRSGTPLELLTKEHAIPTEMLDDQGFLQAGTGVATKLAFPYLDKFAAGNRILINRASLSLSPVVHTVRDNRRPPNGLVFLYADGNGVQYKSDGSQRLLTRGLGSNDNAQMDYIAGGIDYTDLRVTEYIQDVINGIEPNKGLIVAPLGNANSVNRLIFEAPSPINQNPFRIKMFYTLIEEQ